MTRTRQSTGFAALSFVTAIFTRLLAMQEVARQRRQLAQLSDAQLKDIGVTRAEAEREATQPFWRV